MSGTTEPEQSPDETRDEASTSIIQHKPTSDGTSQEMKRKRELDAEAEKQEVGGKRRRAFSESSAGENHQIDVPDGNSCGKLREPHSRQRENYSEEQAIKDRKAMEVWEKIQLAAQERDRKEEAERRAAGDQEDVNPVHSAFDVMLDVLVAEEHARRERHRP